MKLIDRVQRDHEKILAKANLQRAEEEIHTDTIPTSIIDLLGYALEKVPLRVYLDRDRIGYFQGQEDARDQAITMKYDSRSSYDEPFLLFSHPSFQSEFGYLRKDGIQALRAQITMDQPDFVKHYLIVRQEERAATKQFLMEYNESSNRDAYIKAALSEIGKVNPHTNPQPHEIPTAKLLILASEYAMKQGTNIFGEKK